MKNTQIDLSGFSLEEILDAIKKICEDHDDEDGSLYLKRWASSDCGNTDLNFYIKNPNQKEILNLLSSLLK
jgi:hypothetical protein